MLIHIDCYVWCCVKKKVRSIRNYGISHSGTISDCFPTNVTIDVDVIWFFACRITNGGWMPFWKMPKNQFPFTLSIFTVIATVFFSHYFVRKYVCTAVRSAQLFAVTNSSIRQKGAERNENVFYTASQQQENQHTNKKYTLPQREGLREMQVQNEFFFVAMNEYTIFRSGALG